MCGITGIAGENVERGSELIRKMTKTFRIGVIGDSQIEALQVDYDKSFPYLMEKLLNS